MELTAHLLAKDLLPDLGEGFILACLEHYSYDPQQGDQQHPGRAGLAPPSANWTAPDRWEHWVEEARGTQTALVSAGALPISSASHSSSPVSCPQYFPTVAIPNHRS